VSVGAARSQRGVTVVELLVVIAVTGLLAVPVGAWVVSTLGHQDASQHLLRNAVGTGRLAAMFSRDVAEASEVHADDAAADCLGGGGGAGGDVVMVVVPSSSAGRVVYTEARSEETPSQRSLWRRTCDDSGSLVSSSEVFERILPGDSSVACLTDADVVRGCEEDASRLVRLNITACPTRPVNAARTCDPAAGSAEPIELNAQRRVTPGYSGYSGRGPVAQIRVSPRVGYLDTDFTFDASGSRGVDDPGVTVAWEFANATGGATSGDLQVTKRFTGAGEHEVTLRITDGEGRTNAAVTRIRVLNRFPVAEADYESGAFKSRSTHPDGLALSCYWSFGEGMQAHAPSCEDVPSPWGSDAVGRRRAVLVVTDSAGNSDTDTYILDLGTPPSGPITISPTPVEVAGKLPTVGSVGVELDPLEVTFSSEDGDPSATWRLTRRGTPESIATGGGAQLVHTFGPAAHGEYEIARLDAAGGVRGEPVAFRVNAAPVAAFQVSAAGAGGATSFVGDGPNGSSDPDGDPQNSVLSYRWELGWPGWTATGPSPSFVYANPGTYLVKLTVQDEDGVETSTERLVRISGNPAAPPPPGWNGDQLRWDGVPGAEMYRVTVLCTVGAPFVDDVGPDARSVTTPGGFCAGGAVSATLQVRADDKWSSPSSGVSR
jgi:hypothetical protein